jgi:hypothetical protein
MKMPIIFGAGILLKNKLEVDSSKYSFNLKNVIVTFMRGTK